MLNSKIYKSLNVSAWAFIIVAFFIFAIGIYGKMLNDAFVKSGIETLAVVTGKHEKDAVGKTVQKNYYLDVHFETESESIDTYLNTNKRRYDTLNSGDELQIYFLKNNPKTIRLKTSVENFSTTLIFNLSIGFLLLGLVLIFWIKRKTQNSSKLETEVDEHKPGTAG